MKRENQRFVRFGINLKSLACGLLPAILSAAAIGFAPHASAAMERPDIRQVMAAAAQYESGKPSDALRQIEEMLRQTAGDPAGRAEVEKGLARLITGPSTPEARLFACQQLAIIGTETSLAAVGELLKNRETTGMACLALSTQPSPRASEVLRRALPNAADLARVQIIQTLGDLRDPRSVKILEELAGGADVAVAGAAVAALGKIPGADALPALFSLRKADNPALAPAIAEAFLRQCEMLAAANDKEQARALYEGLMFPAQPPQVRRGALNGLLRLDPDGGEKRIMRVLQDSDPVLKPVAISAIRTVPSPRASEKFAQTIPNLAPHEQVLMIKTLAARGDDAALAAVQEGVRAPEPAVRLAAIRALGRHGSTSAAPALARALVEAKAPPERQAAEQALAGLAGGAETTQAIITEMQNAPLEARSGLISVLARRHNRAAVPALLAEAGRSQATVARAAFQALEKLAAAEDAPALIEKLSALQAEEARPEAESAARQALYKVTDGNQRAESVLGVLPQTRSVEARGSLIRLLSACGGARAFSALQRALGDPDARGRDVAIRTLADWPDMTAWNMLVQVYRQPRNEEHRVLALRGLVRLVAEENGNHNPALFERYRQLLGGVRNSEDGKLVLSALSGVAHPEALRMIMPLLNNPGVRAEAVLALKKIAEAVKGKYPREAEEALQRLEQYK